MAQSQIRKFRFRREIWEQHNYVLDVEVAADTVENALEQLDDADFDEFNPGEPGDALDCDENITLIGLKEIGGDNGSSEYTPVEYSRKRTNS